LTAERSKNIKQVNLKEAMKEYQAQVVVVYPTELKKLVVVSIKNVHNINNSNHKAPSHLPFSSLHPPQ
jgi:hypothetical protein